MSINPEIANPDVAVSIVMPCLNEALTLPHCLANAREALDGIRRTLGLEGEIVIADNGSEDGGPALAAGLGARVVAVSERGYGSALRGGCAAAAGRFIVIGDCDGSYDFREAVAMVRRLTEGYDLCMGSRFKGRILPGAMPWKNRHIGNPALTGILNLLFHSGLSDAHCGLRAFTKAAFVRLRLDATGMEFASEIVIKSTLLGLRRTEVPVTLHPDRRDRPPHLRPWRDGWRHLRYLLMLSPTWLFFLPAGTLGLAAVAIFLLLALHPDRPMVPLGNIWFGDHWMVASGAMLAACHQMALFGLASTLHGLRGGYRQVTPATARLLAAFGLERMLFVGALLMLAGAVLAAHVVVVWTVGHFGPLDRIRELVAAVTFGTLGMQTFFGGFFLAIINGNDAELARVPTAPAEGVPADGVNTWPDPTLQA